MGKPRAAVRGKAQRLGESVCAQLRDPSTGVFVDRKGSMHSSLHANVTPLMAGMLGDGDRAPVLDFLRGKRLSCGVYFSFFVLKALYDQGEHERAYDLITSEDLHSWHSMLEAGATTCMEAWAPDLKWNTSWCHPWSSAPIHMMAHAMIALRPKAPGWGEIQFSPRPPKDLASAALKLTTPRGEVTASFSRRPGEVEYHVTVPEGCLAACSFAGSALTVLVNGVAVPSLPAGAVITALADPLGSGTHTIRVKE